jgi:hypothetical protein
VKVGIIVDVGMLLDMSSKSWKDFVPDSTGTGVQKGKSGFVGSGVAVGVAVRTGVASGLLSSLTLSMTNPTTSVITMNRMIRPPHPTPTNFSFLFI